MNVQKDLTEAMIFPSDFLFQDSDNFVMVSYVCDGHLQKTAWLATQLMFLVKKRHVCMMPLNYLDINATECGTEGNSVIFLLQFSIESEIYRENLVWKIVMWIGGSPLGTVSYNHSIMGLEGTLNSAFICVLNLCRCVGKLLRMYKKI